MGDAFFINWLSDLLGARRPHSSVCLVKLYTTLLKGHAAVFNRRLTSFLNLQRPTRNGPLRSDQARPYSSNPS